MQPLTETSASLSGGLRTDSLNGMRSWITLNMRHASERNEKFLKVSDSYFLIALQHWLSFEQSNKRLQEKNFNHINGGIILSHTSFMLKILYIIESDITCCSLASIGIKYKLNISASYYKSILLSSNTEATVHASLSVHVHDVMYAGSISLDK